MSESGTPMWRPRERWAAEDFPPPSAWVRVRRRLFGYLWQWALLAGLALAAVVAVLMSFDYATMLPLPVEQARVTAVEVAPPPGLQCGRSWGPVRGAVRTRFYVADPPAGLANTFTYVTCEPRWQVGEVVPFLRSGPSDDDVMLGPKLTIGDIARVSGLIGGGLAACLYVAVRLRLWLGEILKKYIDRRRTNPA